jgi:K+-sensing histidine kinase KdpD
LSIEPFEFVNCVHDVLERLEHLIESQQAKIDHSRVDPALIIAGDRFYWTQVLFNLIENALKQNPRPGLQVTVSAEIVNNEIQISICDDGIGIPSNHLPFVFKRFYRVDQNHTNSAIKGTGLGLSIVKRAIEEPTRVLAANAGVEGSIVVGKITDNASSETFGFNAQTEEFVDMIKSGIVDPAKVVRTALQDAASVSGLLVTTEAMIADKPKKDAPAMPMGGPGGMGGMDF